MKEFIIKFGCYYVYEGARCYHTVLEREQATTFGSLDSLKNYVEETMCMKLSDVQVIRIQTVEEEIYQCAECLKHFLITHMTSGVVDKETGLEHYCEKCSDDVEFIVQNRKLDEEVE